MKTWLDRTLGRVTMYRLVWLILAGLLLVALGYSLAGQLSFTPVELLVSAAVAVGATVLSSWLLALLVRSRAHLESAIITGLLVFFLFLPTSEPSGVGAIALVGVIASASKYVLAWRRRHLFNPVAVAAVVVALTQLSASAWWVASASLWPFVIVGALLVLYRTRRLAMGLSYIGVAIAITIVRVVSFGSTPFDAFATAVTSYPIVFLAGFMLTEPLTTPPRRVQQILVAVFAAIVASVPFSIGPLYSTPELALVLANLVSFLLGQRRGIVLSLVARRSLGETTEEFVFAPVAPVRFSPGQFVELTLPHRADSRGTRRTFSIASPPSNDGTVSVAMRIPEKASSFKRELAALPVGSRIRATSVGGDFLLPKDPAKPLLLVAGGIGITPFASQVAELAATGGARDVVIVYAVGDHRELAYADVLEAAGVRVLLLAPNGPARLPDNWSYLGASRLTSESLLAAVPDAVVRAAYVSGPPDMVNGVKPVLRRAGVRSIETDYFSGY